MSQENFSEKICFCWNVNYTCNYRCPYCFFYNRWNEVIKDNGNFSATDWINAWQRIYDTYGSTKIETAGGEPFTFPSFVTCVNEICKVHALRVTTNLYCSIGILDSLIKQNSPERLKWNVSFHPSFANFNDFLKKVLFLKENNFEVLVMYVAYPPQLEQATHFKKIFQDKGITFFIQAFQGVYKDISYPGGYSDDEKQKICALKDNGYHEGLKRLIDNQMLQKSTKGKLCLAGYKYAFVDSNGMVYRCTRERKYPMGNFLKHDFKLLEKPSPCEFENCPCEFTWLVEESDENYNIDFNLSDRAKNQQRVKNAVSIKYPTPGRVFWNWDIHYLCNYKCIYCWLTKPHEPSAKDNHSYPGINNLVNIWSNIYKKYGRTHIHISGGEPSIYPSFFELLNELSSMHCLEFDTNLSFQPSAIIGKTRKDAIKINASFHSEFADFNSFFSKVLQLRDHGFKIGISYVGYPPFLEKMREYKDTCEKHNIEFTIQAFRGDLNDKDYPSGYTDLEKKLIGICAEGATERILKYHTEERDKKERKLCRMGQMYAKIYPNGDVYRCCIPESDNKIGNIFVDGFKLLDEPVYCERVPCPCWRAMIVNKEDEWAHYWYTF